MINMQQEHKLPTNTHQYSKNPHTLHEAHLHNLTVSTWCAVTAQKIIEPVTKKKIFWPLC